MKIFLMIMMTSLFLSGPAPAQKCVRLFHIEKNTNANIVCYDARLCSKGNLLEDKPVDVYWVMNEDDGHREDLTWIEKIKAFGLKVSREDDGNFLLKLNAFDKRAITLRKTDDGPKAEILINGKPAFLKKIFVQLEKKFFLPSVEFVELYGIEEESGHEIKEKIIP